MVDEGSPQRMLVEGFLPAQPSLSLKGVRAVVPAGSSAVAVLRLSVPRSSSAMVMVPGSLSVSGD
jgi:hypothetical protein